MADEQLNERLLPCPFCGGEPHLMLNACEGWHVRYIQCDCGARAKEFVYTQPELARSEAIAAWNIRVPAAQADVVLKALYTARHFVAVNGSTGAFNDIVEEINKAIQAMSLYGEVSSRSLAQPPASSPI